MEQQFEEIKQKALKDIESSELIKALDDVRVSLIGKKGVITSLFKDLKNVAAEEKKDFGLAINELKNIVSEAIEKKKEALEKKAFEEKINASKIDVSLPGRTPKVGKLHILTQVEEEIVSVLRGMGFAPVLGYELEDDYHNFEALNIPYYHPARDNHDTIYVSEDRLLRTHTSAMQIRTMKETPPPLAVISPGKCARNDAVDATHSPVFHQVEGFFVDKGVSFADLKGCLLTFFKRMLGESVEIRLRPDFFPFVEPGAEIGVTCFHCNGSGCRTCKNTGFIELLGAGMIHPKVFEHVGYDSTKYSGFAFGMGIDRIALTKYKIPDIRLLYENEYGFLNQF